MSNLNRWTRHPTSKEWHYATWMDDYFDKGEYGVAFPGDDCVYGGKYFRKEDIHYGPGHPDEDPPEFVHEHGVTQFDDEGDPVPVQASALATQVGGDHYKNMKIQPVEFIHANNLDFLQGNVVKYICRHKAKHGKADVEKAIHYCQLILQMEYGE